jgi:hypothetical protein
MPNEPLEQFTGSLWAIEPTLRADVPIPELRLRLEQLTRPAPADAILELRPRIRIRAHRGHLCGQRWLGVLVSA